MQNENTTLEYYKYLRERVENSPLPFLDNKFFPELSSMLTKEENVAFAPRAKKEEKEQNGIINKDC